MTANMPNDDLRIRFSYHRPGVAQAQAHEDIRAASYLMGCAIARLVPEGRERALALTALEEAMMWANAGIAREPAKLAANEALAAPYADLDAADAKPIEPYAGMRLDGVPHAHMPIEGYDGPANCQRCEYAIDNAVHRVAV